MKGWGRDAGGEGLYRGAGEDNQSERRRCLARRLRHEYDGKTPGTGGR